MEALVQVLEKINSNLEKINSTLEKMDEKLDGVNEFLEVISLNDDLNTSIRELTAILYNNM